MFVFNEAHFKDSCQEQAHTHSLIEIMTSKLNELPVINVNHRLSRLMAK